MALAVVWLERGQVDPLIRSAHRGNAGWTGPGKEVRTEMYVIGVDPHKASHTLAVLIRRFPGPSFPHATAIDATSTPTQALGTSIRHAPTGAPVSSHHVDDHDLVLDCVIGTVPWQELS